MNPIEKAWWEIYRITAEIHMTIFCCSFPLYFILSLNLWEFLVSPLDISRAPKHSQVKKKIYKSQTLQHEKPALSVSPFTTSEEINNNHK